jgi:hypothetical protein
LYYFPVHGIAILLVVIVVFLAGCSDSAPSVPSVQTLQDSETVIKTISTPTVTTIPQSAATVQVTATAIPVRIFNGEYHRVEYRENNTVTMPPNPRSSWIYHIGLERSTAEYQGSHALHYKYTSVSDYPELTGNLVTLTKDGWITVAEEYYDESTHEFLGGTMTDTIKGVVQPVTVLPADLKVKYPEASPGGYLGIEPFGEINITFSDKGTESVTVPAGTYPDARKYTGNFRDGAPITFWVVPGIPVPVQYQFPNKHLDGDDPFQSFELVGWG